MTEERKALERLLALLGGALLLAAVLFFALPLVWNYLSPFIIALAIAALLQPAIRWLEKKLHFHRTPATLVCVLLVVLVLVALLVWFLSYGVGQLVLLLNNFGPILNDVTGRLNGAINGMLSAMSTMSDSNVQWIQTTANNAISWLTNQLTVAARWLLTQTLNMASSVPYALIYANFLFIGLYFVSKNYDTIRSRLPGGKQRLNYETRASHELANSAIGGLMGFLKVQGIYSLVALALSAVYWTVLGYTYGAVAAIVAGVLEFIPFFGMGVLYIPWFVIALIIGDTASAVAAIVLYLVFLLFRRITEPKIMSNSLGLTPLESLVGMFVGLSSGGIAGLIGGPVVMTVVMSVVHGHYLDFAVKDVQTLAAFLRRRWAVGSAAPVEKTETAEEKASTETAEAEEVEKK